MNLPNKNEEGQGLLEAIAGISIIIIGLVSIIAVAHSSMASHYQAETRIVAANLAREAAEAVHNIRDSNYLAESPWDNGLYTGADYTGVPIFNYTDFSYTVRHWSIEFGPNDFSDNRTQVYKFKAGASSGLYAQFSTLPAPAQTGETIYKRLMTLKAICFDGSTQTINNSASCASGTKIGVRIVVEVRWQEHGRSHNLVLEDSVYDWRQ